MIWLLNSLKNASRFYLSERPPLPLILSTPISHINPYVSLTEGRARWIPTVGIVSAASVHYSCVLLSAVPILNCKKIVPCFGLRSSWCCMPAVVWEGKAHNHWAPIQHTLVLVQPLMNTILSHSLTVLQDMFCMIYFTLFVDKLLSVWHVDADAPLYLSLIFFRERRINLKIK